MAQIKCPHCALTTEYGVRVCRGCHAEVKYGADLSFAFVIIPVLVFGLMRFVCDYFHLDFFDERTMIIGGIITLALITWYVTSNNSQVRFIRYRRR